MLQMCSSNNGGASSRPARRNLSHVSAAETDLSSMTMGFSGAVSPESPPAQQQQQQHHRVPHPGTPFVASTTTSPPSSTPFRWNAVGAPPPQPQYPAPASSMAEENSADFALMAGLMATGGSTEDGGRSA
jgi:hypothetical protein